MPISAASARDLRSIIDANLNVPTAPGMPAAAPQNFCTIWPTAKPILQFLAGVVPFIPGVGAGAGAALTALIAAGQAVYDQTCGAAGGAVPATP